MSNRYRTILFDLDGTLIDNVATFRSIFSIISQKYPIFLGHEESLLPIRESSYVALCRELSWEDAPTFAEYWGSISEYYLRATLCFPSALPTLKALKEKGYTLGIITNGGTYGQNAKIDAADLRRYFDAVLVSGSLEVRKPDPQIYEMALEQLGAERETTLFVGDNPATDILGAQCAGIDSFLITAGEESFGATYIGTDLSDLLDLL